MAHVENIEKSCPLAGGRSWVLRNVNLDIADAHHRGIRVIAAAATRGSDESDRGVAP